MADSAAVPFADPFWYQNDTSIYYNDSHKRLQKVVRKYVTEHIEPHCEEWERQGMVPPEAIKRHADEGYMAISMYPLARANLDGQRLPGNINPAEWDGFHDLICIDEIARCGYLGVIWALSCGNSIGAPPLILYGSEEQKRRWLPDVIKGRIRFCLGVTEPTAGSDVASITTTATRDGNEYIVNGTKKWITNAIFADFCTLAVRTGKPGAGGISVLIVPLNAKGVTRRSMENSGVSCSGSTFIEFDDVRVPVANRLGEENAGFEIIMSNFNHERLWLACTALRLARVCAHDSYTHATTRETFGRPLIDNQVIRSKISMMGRSIDSAHAWMEELVHAASIVKNNPSGVARLAGKTAGLKVLAGQVLEKVNREAQQIFGGLGYCRTGRGARVEQISRDVRVLVVGGGSEEILADMSLRQEVKGLSLQNVSSKL